MSRQTVFDYVREKYQSVPEYLWKNGPKDAVFRHVDNGKWYAVVMNVAKKRLGMNGTENIDLMNVKIPPEMAGVLRSKKGIFPAYHMNKEHWISVLLDGSIDEEQICYLLDLSFELTGNRKK